MVQTLLLVAMVTIRELTVVDNKPDWLTNELLMQMRQRDKAFRKARNTKSHGLGNCQTTEE